MWRLSAGSGPALLWAMEVYQKQEGKQPRSQDLLGLTHLR